MFEFEELPEGQGYRIAGRLPVASVPTLVARLRSIRAGAPDAAARTWDLRDADEVGTAAALTLWNAWGGRRPKRLFVSDRQAPLFQRLEQMDAEALAYPHARRRRADVSSRGPVTSIVGLLSVFGRFVLDCLQALRRPVLLPWKETSAACYRAGATALPVVCLVGLLIGIVLSYLSSLQLRYYGAESFLPMILGVGVVRELGPLLAAIVIAGRSGSSFTAGIGAMRLTQELDALSALGISHSLRLVLPRTLGLALTMPLLVVCTNLAALIGGMLSGWVELDISPRAFVLGLHADVSIVHFNIGLFKSFVFGLAIGLIACYFGLTARANTQSLSRQTTRSVVLSLSTIILLDAFFAVLFKDVPA